MCGPLLWQDMRVSSLPASVLIVRLGAIGDVVNALVVATAIKDAAPKTRIGWAVHPLAAPLVEDHPCVDRVHLWKRGSGYAGWRALKREIRQEGYGLSIDLQRILKSGLLARSSGASRVLGFDRGRCKEASWLLTSEQIPPGEPRTLMTDQYMEFVRHLGIRATAARHELPRDPGAESWAAALVENMESAPILINLGASKSANQWPANRFGELAAQLHADLGVPIVFTGGEADRAAGARALTNAGGVGLDLSGQTSLPQLIALLGRARLFIGCDTGPMHMAAAQGTAVLALFGPADPLRTGPYGSNCRVLQEPTQTLERPFKPGRMDSLQIDTVRAAALEMLGAAS